MSFQASIVSTERELFNGQVEYLSAPGTLGELGILSGHTPLLTRLNSGSVSLRMADQSIEHIWISGGILEVQPHMVTLLADTGIRAADLDEAAILAAKARAEELMQDRSESLDIAETEAELLNAINQLRTLERYRRQRG